MSSLFEMANIDSTSKTNKSHVVVLGTGSIGTRHLKTFRSLPEARVTAVPVRPQRVPELRSQGFAAVESLEEALAMRPDGVVIATDSGRHAPDARTCLRAGCNVLVEKPMALDARAADELGNEAHKAGRTLFVACCLRFDAGLRWVRQVLPRIGRPLVADIECFSWLPSWRPGRQASASYSGRAGEGGVLLDLIHEIDYAAWILGPQRAVFARLLNQAVLGVPAEVEETALMTWEHADGVHASVRLGYATRSATRTLRIWGTDGVVSWDGIARTASHRMADGSEAARFTWEGPEQMYEEQASSWLAHLRGGVSGELASGEAGRSALAVCDAARLSSRDGRWEPVA